MLAELRFSPSISALTARIFTDTFWLFVLFIVASFSKCSCLCHCLVNFCELTLRHGLLGFLYLSLDFI
jgi:hypothetical protein